MSSDISEYFKPVEERMLKERENTKTWMFCSQENGCTNIGN
jgi:hypothetical protein